MADQDETSDDETSDDRAPDAESPRQNRLLEALPAGEHARLLPYLEPVALATKFSIYQPNQPISHVYFLESGVASILAVTREGGAVEVSTVGNEGMMGLPVFLGATSTPTRSFMQVPGDALRMPSDTFRRVVIPGGRLHALLQRYTQALMIQMAQGVLCNRLHTIEQRCCRWLLTTADRVGAETFPLTQEFLAEMLGVRRASVSEVASELQRQGLVSYQRGAMTLLNREGLEARSCECYFIIRAEFERMLG